jgi:hypothetical protein
VELIGATTTRTGLTVRAELDPGAYPKGIKVADKELAAVPIHRHEFHGEWNYTSNCSGPCCRAATELTVGRLLV